MSRSPAHTQNLLNGALLKAALVQSLLKLDPRETYKNPVLLVVEVGSLLTTGVWIRSLLAPQPEDAPLWFTGALSVWLWFTVIFSTFSEAIAEGRGRAQAAALRQMRKESWARRQVEPMRIHPETGQPVTEWIEASSLRKGDIVVVVAGELIPGDGEVLAGVAAVDESAITGESAPVIRESGGDRSAVTGGTKVISDTLTLRIRSNPGETFLDRMIALVEGASRKKTPNELALHILLVGLTLIFLLACVTLVPLAAASGIRLSLSLMIALLVCLIPTTIGGLLSAIGIAGMDRLLSKNVLAMSGRAVEAAGDVDVLLLDKTGTITHGNRQAAELIPLAGVSQARLAEAALLASLADETPEGRSIVSLVRAREGVAGWEQLPPEAIIIPFTAETRMSGLELPQRVLRKGAVDAVVQHLQRLEGLHVSGSATEEAERVAARLGDGGGTPLSVVDNS